MQRQRSAPKNSSFRHASHKKRIHRRKEFFAGFFREKFWNSKIMVNFAAHFGVEYSTRTWRTLAMPIVQRQDKPGNKQCPLSRFPFRGGRLNGTRHDEMNKQKYNFNSKESGSN